MGRILTIAHHTIREAVRMRIVLAFAVLMLMLILGLPFAIDRPNATLSATVQTFLTWSLIPLSIILSFLAIFLSCLSISEEMYHRQIFTLATKPIPRWQYIFGKWVGVAVVLTGLLIFGTLCIYGMSRWIARRDPVDGVDAFRLKNEVFVARAASPLHVPDFVASAEVIFQQRVEAGAWNESSGVSRTEAKVRILNELRQQWRSVPPGSAREFEFRDLTLVERRRDRTMQLRYKAKGLGYRADEVLQTYWTFGNPRNADVFWRVPRRDVMDRYHVIPFPASTISPDGTLVVRVENADNERPDGRGATISFESDEGLEVLYDIGSFEGNLLRTTVLTWCRLLLVAGTGVFAATFLSYPVACLMAFMFYILCVSGGYVKEALGFGGAQTGVFGAAKPAIKAILEAIFWILPEFNHYDGVPTFVDGRVVTLMWDIQAFGKLVLLLTTLFLLVACAIFRRRQVAELSI